MKEAIRHPALRKRLARLPGLRLLYGSGWDRLHPFDDSNATDTSGFVSASELPEDHPASSRAIFYAGSQPSVMRAALAALPAVDSCTFVDLGCGKGRALLIASELPFKDIVGVELSPQLAKVARDNAAIAGARHLGRTPVRIEQGDATAFPLPAGDLVIYLYHPFDGEMIRKVAASIDAALDSEARSVYVIYYNPVDAQYFDALPRLTRRYGRTLQYAPEEIGCGPDDCDAVVIWQAGSTAPFTEPTDFRIVVSNRTRALIEF